METDHSALDARREQLVERIRALQSCAVALSGGVDSVVVAQAAQWALGERAIAITAASLSLPRGELDVARDLANQIGITHVVIDTQELQRAGYVQNGSDRCYFCKSELYGQMAHWLDTHAPWNTRPRWLVNGTNADDLTDHRPGLRAAVEQTVRSPLAECGLRKSEVRALARVWGLSVADKPAMPCLASRIAYGESVTPERLQRIDAAETWLRTRGFSDLRVRLHPGDLARVELPLDQLARLVSEPLRSEFTDHMERLGFRFTTLDVAGRQSGSLNRVLPTELLEIAAHP